jgi:hypothetical protein
MNSEHKITYKLKVLVKYKKSILKMLTEGTAGNYDFFSSGDP